MSTPTTLQYTKAVTQSTVTVAYSFDTLAINTNTASTGVFLTLTSPVQEIAGSTVTKGTPGSNITTISTNVPEGFKFLKVGQIVTLKTDNTGGAVLPASSTIVSKPNNTSIVVDKETAVTNSSAVNTSTISVAGVSTNIALAKIEIALNGLGGTSISPVVKTSYYDGAVTYSTATISNASDTQTSTKAISVESLLVKAGIPPFNTDTADIST